MEKKTYSHLDLDVYEDVLDNGLRVFIAPLDRYEAYAKITTLYGARTLEFKPPLKDEYVKIPEGTAHFLEHKMFAKEDGTDTMSLFQNNGAMSNAYTTAHVTSYYFMAPNKFYENLGYLLDLVTKPYYTKENVEKEKGIIDQEIKAGFDNPGEASYYATLLNTFHKIPYRYPVAGYPESIKKITPEILYDSYNTFYHPSNMVLTITGNVKPDEVIKFVKEYYAKFDYKKMDEIKVMTYDEPRTVFKKEEILYKDVTNNILENAYKVCLDDSPLDLFKTLTYANIYLDAKFGSISKFNKACFENKNIISPIRYMMDSVDNYLFIDFDTEVLEVKEVFDKIYANINDKTFDEKDFDLILKNTIKSVILMTDSVNSINNSIDYQVRKYGNVCYDMYDIYKSLTYEECLKVINSLDFTNNTRTITRRAD